MNRYLYGLIQASRKWFLKFDHVMISFGFTINKIDQCIYLKVSGSKFIFLALCVDDVLLTNSDTEILRDTTQFLSKYFEIPKLGENLFGIKIIMDKSRGLLHLYHKSFIDQLLKRFHMQSRSHGAF